MYRVAVLQNESEVLRSGFANVTPKLQSLNLSSYEFESFTSMNVNVLFGNGENCLETFDSIFLTTNVTSDKFVLEALKKNVDRVTDFIKSGKGLFVSSQRGIRTTMGDLSGDSGITGFLPKNYDFRTVERPSDEEDSGKGQVSVNQDSRDNILLVFPNQITGKLINERCMNNEFRRHFYRSHLVPVTAGAYIPLLLDTSYKVQNFRVLLMVGSAPNLDERVVVSTISIDWEFQNEILENIVRYITEGPPRLAFIEREKVETGDYLFLKSNAISNKIPFVVYSAPDAISKIMSNVHNTYILSPGWTEEEVDKFLHSDALSTLKGTSASYKKVYFFQLYAKQLVLSQYSTFGNVDLIIDQSVQWLLSKFDNRMWLGNFWITTDLISMLETYSMSYEPYLEPVLVDIKKHYKHGSYDGVMGATTGLLKLLTLANKKYPSICEMAKMGSDTINESLKWVIDNFYSQSLNDKIAAFISVRNVLNEPSLRPILNLPMLEETSRNMWNEVTNQINVADLENSFIPGRTEIDLLRYLDFFISSVTEYQSTIAAILNQLRKLQLRGKWMDVVRTSHVIETLLEVESRLDQAKNEIESNTGLRENIDEGISYLLSEFDPKTSSWKQDLQATAKSVRALILYNKKYNYSTQDILGILKRESEEMESESIILELSSNLDKSRKEINDKVTLIKRLTNNVEVYKNRLKHNPFWRTAGIFSTAILIVVIGAITVTRPGTIMYYMKVILVPSFITVLILTLMVTLIIPYLSKHEELELEEKKELK
jgi:hypothetical protein